MKPWSYLAHGDVVETVGTVEDDTLDGESFGEILGGLCLASSSRTFRRAIQVEVVGADEGAVAPVRQRGDDEAWRIPEIFVGVGHHGVRQTNLDAHFAINCVAVVNSACQNSLWATVYNSTQRSQYLILNENSDGGTL